MAVGRPAPRSTPTSHRKRACGCMPSQSSNLRKHATAAAFAPSASSWVTLFESSTSSPSRPEGKRPSLVRPTWGSISCAHSKLATRRVVATCPEPCTPNYGLGLPQTRMLVQLVRRSIVTPGPQWSGHGSANSFARAVRAAPSTKQRCYEVLAW